MADLKMDFDRRFYTEKALKTAIKDYKEAGAELQIEKTKDFFFVTMIKGIESQGANTGLEFCNHVLWRMAN